MKRRLIGAVLIGLVVMLATAGVTTANKALPETQKLTLSQAVELGEKNNPSIELATLGVEKAKLSVEQANFNADKWKKMLGNSSGDQNTFIQTDIVPKQAQSGLVIAEASLDFTRNNIKYGIETAYYGVLKAEKYLQVADASYKRAQEQLKHAQARFKAGTAAKIEVITAESQLKSAEAARNQAENGVKVAKMSLNKLLRLNLDTPLSLTNKFDFKQVAPIDVDKVIQDRLDTDFNVIMARESYNNSKLMFDYNKTYYTVNTFAYREAEYNFKEAEIKYDNARIDLRFNIKKAYLDLKTAEENYHVLTKSMEQAKEAFRLTKLRYNVGMATGFDVLNAETALKQAEMALLNALYDYNLSKAKFTYGIFGGAAGASTSGAIGGSAGMTGGGQSGGM